MTLDIACVDAVVLRKFCAKYGLDVGEDEPVADVAAAFAEYVVGNVPASKQATCDNCKGDSSIDDECCPYCGAGGFDNSVPAAAAPVPAKPEPVVVTTKSKKEAQKKKRSEAGAADAAVVVPRKATAPKAKNAAAAVDALAPETAAVTEPEPMGDRSPMAEDEQLVTSTPAEEDDPVVVKMNTMLAQQVDKLAAARDIGIAIEAVHEAKKLAVVGYWHLGQAILRCFEGDLWKQTRDEKGNPKHKGFGAFCEAELKLSSRYCYTLMEISSQFTATDVAKIGVAKLGQILKVAPAQRTKLLEEAREGAPLSALAKQVQRITAKTGTSGAGAGKKDNTAARTAASARASTSRVEADNVITATHEAKRVKIKLYAKGSQEAKRAKRLADEPTGTEVAMNGVTIRYTVTKNANDELQLIIERLRAE